jgi:glucosylceramidase
MRLNFLTSAFMMLAFSSYAQITWVSTTQDKHWIQNPLTYSGKADAVDAEINPAKQYQTIEGFGTCFNEMGWVALNSLSPQDKKTIFNELFAPNQGANFTICRMPVGANDFSIDWYSYNETDGDLAMKNFSIANDKKALIPFIKKALNYNPNLKLWASPWSPPSWMKYNKHYALARPKPDQMVENGLRPDQVGKEGTDMFIQEDKYMEAYAVYFEKFIKAYRKEGIKIAMVMPQNEFNSVQQFPSCTWTAKGLTNFISFLGPKMDKQNVDIFFGTMERPNEKLVDSVLESPKSGRYIKGVGFQWAGKEAIPGIYKRYPQLPLYQTEQECGDGKNDWAYCVYAWNLMKHYINNGVSSYLYWNTALKEGGISRWGWRQNSLISVDTTRNTYTFNHEYYLMKHLSHFVKPGARRIQVDGGFGNMLAFLNKDNSVALIAYNESDMDRLLKLKVNNKFLSPNLKANSFNTILISQ